MEALAGAVVAVELLGNEEISRFFVVQWLPGTGAICARDVGFVEADAEGLAFGEVGVLEHGSGEIDVEELSGIEFCVAEIAAGELVGVEGLVGVGG